jgi:hypothetical protein
MTAPLAIVQVNGVTVGKMRNIRVTEQIRRGRVSGLGRLTAEELPALEWSGSLSCSSYTINFNLLMNKSQLGTFRNAFTVNDWANAILLQEDGLEISLLRKVKDGEIDPETGMVKTKYETFAKVNAAFATREGFDVQEGQISGRDTEFEYLEPILYNGVV